MNKLAAALQALLMTLRSFVTREYVRFNLVEPDIKSHNHRMVVVVTNSPKEEELASLEMFQRIKGSMTPTRVFEAQIEAGLPPVSPNHMAPNWCHPLIAQLAIPRSSKFRVELHKAGTMSLPKFERKRELASYSFSAEGATTDVYLQDKEGKMVKWDDFPAHIGLSVSNSKKLEKRLKELVREAQLWLFLPKGGTSFHWVETDNEMKGDGVVLISMGFAIKMANSIPEKKVRDAKVKAIKAGKVVRGDIRILTRGGLLKGNAIIVPDRMIKQKYGKVYDVVGHSFEGEPINIKSELSTDGWELATFNPQHPHGPGLTNDQMLACMGSGRWIFPKEELKEDLGNLFESTFSSLYSGVMPEALKVNWDHKGGEEKHSNATSFRRLAMDYCEARKDFTETPLKESAYLLQRLIEGFFLQQARHFQARLFSSDGMLLENKNTVKVPIRHSMLAHVTTMAVVELAGYDPASEGFDTSKTFWYEPVHSLVMPDQAFIDAYSLHGGWDLDDSVYLVARRMYDSSKGQEAKDAVVKAVFIRMPQNWGEYSIQEVDYDSLPLYTVDTEIPVLDIGDKARPEMLHEMKQKLMGMPLDPTIVPADYTRDWAKGRMELSQANPGIGSVVNPAMAYYATVGTYFKVALAAMEDMVDCTQQTPYMEGFAAIREEVKSMKLAIKRAGIPLDRHIAETRVPTLMNDPEVKVTNDGYYSDLIRFGQTLLTEYRGKAKELSIKNRQVIEVGDLPETLKVVRGDMVETWNTKEYAKVLLKKFKVHCANVGLIPLGEPRHEHWGKYNNALVKGLIDQPDRDIILLALYRHVVENNEKDGVLFQTPLHDDDTSIMHLLIKALHSRDLAKISHYDENGWYQFHLPPYKGL